MQSTAGSQLYKHKEETWFGDGREEQALEYVRGRVAQNTTIGSDEVLRLIDEYGAAHKYMMNVGSEKGRIVRDLIQQRKPQIMVELGGYIGYSTLLFASALRRSGGAQYISFERDARFAAVAQAFVDLADLSSIVRIVVGSSSQQLVAEHAAGRLPKFDMIFLDHYKPAYVIDIKICESLGLISENTVLVADNVISPGNPPYLEYVRSTPDEKRARLDSVDTQSGTAFPERAVNQYQKQVFQTDETILPGVPGIVYASQLVHSHEPTGEADGLEITVCKSTPA